MRSLDSISFDDSAYSFQGVLNGARVWRTPAADGIGLFYFDRPPDIAADLNTIDEVRAFYRKGATAAGFGVIEVETCAGNGYVLVRTIFKLPQQPTGMSYVGCITLPFRDFSYLLRIECLEHGMTGLREAFVIAVLLDSGKLDLASALHSSQIKLDERGSARIPGWMQDPYDPTADAPLMRNLAEDEHYDVQFPEHPLSRLRSILLQIQSSLRLTQEVKDAPRFVFQQRGVAAVRGRSGANRRVSKTIT